MKQKPTDEVSIRRQRILFSILRFGVAAGLIAWLLHSIALSRIASVLASASLGYLWPAVMTVALSMYLEALRTRIIARAQGIAVTTSQMLVIDLGASFYALFLPWGTLSRGGVRIYRLGRAGKDTSAAAITIFRDRLESTAVMAATGLGFWVYGHPSNADSAALLMAGCVLAAVAVYLVVFAPVKIFDLTLSEKIPGVSRLKQLRSSIGRARAMSMLLQLELLLYSVVMHLSIVLTFYFLARSLGLDILPVTMGWVRSAVTVITMLPVTVGGLGLRETAMLFFLEPYAVQEAQAIALSFLIFIFVLLLPGCFGGLLEAWRVVSNRRAGR